MLAVLHRAYFPEILHSFTIGLFNDYAETDVMLCSLKPLDMMRSVAEQWPIGRTADHPRETRQRSGYAFVVRMGQGKGLLDSRIRLRIIIF